MKTRQTNRRSFLASAGALMAALVALVIAGGCRSADDGVAPADRQKGNRIDEIAKASGGDWDKVPDADKRFLLNDIAHGNENSARMILLAKSGKMQVGPPTGGGPPRPGTLPGPPKP